MKKILSLLLLTLIFALAFTSCTALKGAFVKCEVKFDLDGGVAGEGFIESVTVKYGKTVAMSTPTRENFTFEGWYDGDTLYTEETPITKDVTLRAKWTFNNTYTLTFETNGMADVPASHPIIGELPKIPATPLVDGYVFAGWYFDAEYTTRYFFDYPLSEATTLYAKFYDLSLGEYIVISNVDQLMAIKDAPDAKYLLACDINCKGETLIPINEFSGEIEGNGYKIFNFTLNKVSNNTAFISTNKGIVKNLTFDNFTFDILINQSGIKYYSVICGINYGSVENCHTLNGDIKVDYTYLGEVFAYVSGIVAYNNGTIEGCTNNSNINVFVFADEDRGANMVYSYIGGICGFVNSEAQVIDCVNNADIKVNANSDGYGINYISLGGAIGYAQGYVDKTANLGNLTIKSTSSSNYPARLYVGGSVGRNNGATIKNSYAICDILIENSTLVASDKNLIGGFAGYNSGKIYNCYSVVNIKDNTEQNYTIGGFVGFNELVSGLDSLINKCFAIGSIELAGVPTNIGYFAGTNSGTVKDSYYADTLTINKVVATENENGESVETLEAIEVTNTLGEAKAESELLSVDFLENTLYFDRMVWFLVDGKLPELR